MQPPEFDQAMNFLIKLLKKKKPNYSIEQDRQELRTNQQSNSTTEQKS